MTEWLLEEYYGNSDARHVVGALFICLEGNTDHETLGSVELLCQWLLKYGHDPGRGFATERALGETGKFMARVGGRQGNRGVLEVAIDSYAFEKFSSDIFLWHSRPPPAARVARMWRLIEYMARHPQIIFETSLACLLGPTIAMLWEAHTKRRNCLSCAYCKKPAAKICSRCSSVRFCSTGCQKAVHGVHKLACCIPGDLPADTLLHGPVYELVKLFVGLGSDYVAVDSQGRSLVQLLVDHFELTALKIMAVARKGVSAHGLVCVNSLHATSREHKATLARLQQAS